VNKEAAYRLGLIVPDGEGHDVAACCGYKQPSLAEQELAAHKHRWAEMRELQVRFWRALMQEVTEMESDMLAALKLPGIDEVREADATNTEQPGGQFVFGVHQERELDRILDGFIKRIMGSDWETKGAGEELAVYIIYLMEAFAIAAKYIKRLIINNLPEGIDPALVTAIMPDPDARYFRAMRKAAGDRITTELALSRLARVKKILREMAKAGDWPIKAARRLHREIGEGLAWYWNRIARTESTLAANEAFNQMARANGALYEKWSAAPTACAICAAFDGEVWKVGEGPEPAASTHPHCLCIRIPLYTAPRYNPAWTRPEPYGPGNGYTREEIDNLRQIIRGIP